MAAFLFHGRTTGMNHKTQPYTSIYFGYASQTIIWILYGSQKNRQPGAALLLILLHQVIFLSFLF